MENQKINFNFENTAIHSSLLWGNFPVFKWARLFEKLFFFIFSFLFLVFLFGFFSDSIPVNNLSFLFGSSVLFFTAGLFFWWNESFFNLKLKCPKLKVESKEVLKNPQDFNLADLLSFNSAKAVKDAVSFAKSQKTYQVSSTTLLYNLLKKNKDFNFIFSRVLLNKKELEKVLRQFLKETTSQKKKRGDSKKQLVYTDDFKEAILESLKSSEKKGHERIRSSDLLVGLVKADLIMKKILIESNLKLEDFENLTWWLETIKKRSFDRKIFWNKKNLAKKGSLAKAWSSGYTVTLDRFSIDYSEIIRRSGLPETIGHEKELKVVERILARSEINNCLLIGERGVGKKSIILELAKRSLLGDSFQEVNFKRVVRLDLQFLATQTETVAEVESTLDRIFREAVSAGNIIIVIDEIHNFAMGSNRPGAMDISGIIAPYLNMPQFQIVGITTFSGLHKYLEQNPPFLSLFEKVELSEVSSRETLMVLESMVPALERKYKSFISFMALREIISLASKYYPIPFPKSAMDLLDEVMIYVFSLKEKIVLPKHVATIVSGKTEIPVGEIEDKERVTLLSLENLIHERIINQVEAVREVATALRRARAQVTIRKGPMGTFLFLGPTGVGKTETSKALAAVYFGSEEKMIRLDMSEFQNISDIPRLLGSPGEEGLLTTQVREKPFSLILLDELEKAHSNVLNLFLQVLDEGFLTDGLGRKVDFKNCIIIATSNAGYKIILKALKESKEWIGVKKEIIDYLFEEGIFRPEFINRFDAVVVFHPLSKDNLLAISEIMLKKLQGSLKDKGIDFVITLPLKKKIVELGYDQTFGAREMRRVIQDKVENAFALALLTGEIERGDKLEIDPETFQVKVF
ncbi:MAG: ATP-dependent Clp protease ATP-binding subunit [Candidatus Nealsonbacteria bacterium]